MSDRKRLVPTAAGITTGEGRPATRRDFIRRAALTAIAAPAAASILSACDDDSKAGAQQPVTTTPASPKSQTPMEHGGTLPTPASGAVAATAADAMDAMHEKGIKAFPAKTAGKGNQLFTPKIEKGVKVF
jgi:hypothetical protein